MLEAGNGPKSLARNPQSYWFGLGFNSHNTFTMTHRPRHFASCR